MKPQIQMKAFFLFLLSLLAFSPVHAASDNTIPLKGEWKFQTDPLDKGISEQWFARSLSETVRLPGSMSENGKGDELTLKTKWTGSIYDSSWYYNPRMAKYRQPGNLKFPFWLTPDKYYVGAAWYQKEVDIPAVWKGRRIVLFLERPHWQTMVWVDNILIGSQNSLSTPHDYDLTSFLAPGKHTLTIRVDNRTKTVNPGQDSHSITDHTQGNWNGIAGQMNLTAGSPVFFDDLRIYPDIKAKRIKVMMNIKNSTSLPDVAKIGLTAGLLNGTGGKKLKSLTSKVKVAKGDNILELIYSMGEDPRLWDEFNPAVYQLRAVVTDKSGNRDEKLVMFGMREFTANGTHFEINGHPTFLRGTVENCVFPLTGYPPTDEASWARVFSICRAHGLNHMRFHSFCPPEAAFIAADKAGFYLHVECGSWANHGVSLGRGEAIDRYIYDESERIVREYGNHPSFCMMAYGNEPRGSYVPYLNKFVDYWKAKDPRRLYTGAAIGGSWSIIPASEYLVRATPRGLPWSNSLPSTTFDFRNKLENQTIPYVSHEVGQYCVFPDFKEIGKYTGPLKARNFELFQEDLGDHHMGDQANDFMMASGKLQALCYKAEIEAALRTPGFAGFELLALNDYPGQGTALVGVLDAFWDEKGYSTAPEFNRFCNHTVPLARIPKFVYTNKETFSAAVEVAHFSDQPMENASSSWKITDENGQIISLGSFPKKNIPDGNCIPLGNVVFPLAGIEKAGQYKFEVTVGQYSNDWNFWVYPQVLPRVNTDDIYTCSELDTQAEEILKNGGKVFLLAAGKVQNGNEVVQTFTPVFWNTSWFKMRPPHTTGILVKPDHPAFKYFPTSYHSDLQWWELLNHQQVMILDSFPVGLRPLVQPIDTWFLNRRLGMLFEAKVGNGKLMVCSSDLANDLDKRPVARQLLYSLTLYMESDKFVPQCSVGLSVIKELFEKKDRSGYRIYTKDSPDELKKIVK